MTDLENLRTETRRIIYERNGTILRKELYSNFLDFCNQLGWTKYEYDKKIAKPIYDEYNREEQELIQQVKLYLQNEHGNAEIANIYTHFLLICEKLFLTKDSFSKRILKKSTALLEKGSLSQTEKQQKHATTIKLDEKLNTKKNEIQNFDAFSDWLIKIAFEDGIVENDEIQKILTKSEENNYPVTLIINKIKERLDKENYKSYPKANLEANNYKDVLLSTNWYCESIYNALTSSIPKKEESRIETTKLQKNKKPILPIIIFLGLILGSLFLLVILFTNEDKTGGYINWYCRYLDGYFWGLIFLLILSFVIFHGQFRNLRKPPFYIRVLMFFIAACFFVLPFLFERYGDNLDDYDQNHQSGFYWAWPSNILKYPLENLKLNNIDDTSCTPLIFPKASLGNNDDLDQTYTITIIDKTLSGKADSSTTKSSILERAKLISAISESNFSAKRFDSLQFRDLLALYINLDSSRLFNSKSISSTYIFNGIDSGQHFTLSNSDDQGMNYKTNYLHNYLSLRTYTDSIIETNKNNKRKKNKGRTDFSMFCKLVSKDLSNQINENHELFTGVNVSLHIISDFYHEVIDENYPDSIVKYITVEKSISDLLHTIGNSLIQIDLYKLPMPNKSNKKEAVDSLLSSFNIKCDKPKPRIHNIEDFLLSGNSFTYPGFLIPPIGKWQGNSLQFTYKKRDDLAKAISKIGYSESYDKDTLTCCLIDKAIWHNNNKDYYKINYSENNTETDSDANINTPFVLNSFQGGKNLFLSMDKKYITKESANFSFEVYSKKMKKKFALPVEFRMPGSNPINYFLFLFEAIAYFSLLLLLLIVFHKINLATIFDSACLTPATSALSFFALFLPILVSFILFNRFIEQYNVDPNLESAFFALAFIVYGMTLYSYRHNNSKFLNQPDNTALSIKSGSLFGVLLYDKKARN